MPARTVSVDDAVAILNELTEADPAAMESLCETRVSCNDNIANHPTAQVAVRDGVPQIGLLGVLNAIFGCDSNGWGYIAGEYTDGGKHLLYFRRLDRKD